MDTELFELCKEVYKRTRWQPTGYFDGDYVVTQEDADAGGYDDDQLKPLYTSDYLLEKLPSKLDGNLLLEADGSAADKWCAYYDSMPVKIIAFHELTPLKALLKLTIALHDAGELK
jgi:hypothetical protein